ncbi:hypothetical protein [Pasteuria penetrans]|uniref:hypothetical protein n=1 Tax=Pasteuria penetrans TaxID=86005 RepID=UPI0011EFF181|nr:hypothetical protein [Pasteuria penetrans]
MDRYLSQGCGGILPFGTLLGLQRDDSRTRDVWGLVDGERGIPNWDLWVYDRFSLVEKVLSSGGSTLGGRNDPLGRVRNAEIASGRSTDALVARPRGWVRYSFLG